jgi:hypothetical protein
MNIFAAKQLCRAQTPIFWSLAKLLQCSQNENNEVILPDALLFKPKPRKQRKEKEDIQPDDQSLDCLLSADRCVDCSAQVKLRLGPKSEQQETISSA